MIEVEKGPPGYISTRACCCVRLGSCSGNVVHARVMVTIENKFSIPAEPTVLLQVAYIGIKHTTDRHNRW
jgi:hypothetical protein